MQNEMTQMTAYQYKRFLAFKKEFLDPAPPEKWVKIDKFVANGNPFIPINTLRAHMEKLFPFYKILPVSSKSHIITAKKKGNYFDTIVTQVSVHLVAPLYLLNKDTDEYEYICTMSRVGIAQTIRSEDRAVNEKSPQSAMSLAEKNAFSKLGNKFGAQLLLTEEGNKIHHFSQEKMEAMKASKTRAEINIPKDI